MNHHEQQYYHEQTRLAAIQMVGGPILFFIFLLILGGNFQNLLPIIVFYVIITPLNLIGLFSSRRLLFLLRTQYPEQLNAMKIYPKDPVNDEFYQINPFKAFQLITYVSSSNTFEDDELIKLKQRLRNLIGLGVFVVFPVALVLASWLSS